MIELEGPELDLVTDGLRAVLDAGVVEYADTGMLHDRAERLSTHAESDLDA